MAAHSSKKQPAQNVAQKSNSMRKPKKGEIVKCRDCGSDLEVTSVSSA